MDGPVQKQQLNCEIWHKRNGKEKNCANYSPCIKLQGITVPLIIVYVVQKLQIRHPSDVITGKCTTTS